MVVSVKDSIKLVGISIITFCAVFVCTLFLNYNMDIVGLESQIVPENKPLYDAVVQTSIVTCVVTGMCLLMTSVVMLIFYVKHYVDTHRKELGILKALGYSDFSVAKKFWVFGLSVLVGTALGFASAMAMMPKFYELQSKDHLLPDFDMHFHFVLLVLSVVVPTVLFALLACGYAFLKLRQPTINLLKDSENVKRHPKKAAKIKDKDRSFVRDLQIENIKSKKILVFFIVFASFCFSAMTQMSFSMKDLSSEMMGLMMLIIGLVLAFTTLLISAMTVVNGSKKSIALMKAMGYTEMQCASAFLNVYRPFAYVGFVIGTGYQYGLLRLMVDIVFKDVDIVPEYNFDWKAMLVSLAVFAVFYELTMFLYSRSIGKVSIKKIMLD